jgi:hypothetical protein
METLIFSVGKTSGRFGSKFVTDNDNKDEHSSSTSIGAEMSKL